MSRSVSSPKASAQRAASAPRKAAAQRSAASKPAFHAGIDVGKRELAVAVLHADGSLTQFTCANDGAGHKKLSARFKREGDCVRVVLEATSNFSLDLAFALSAAGLCVCLINPRQSRDFAKSLNTRAKTDRVDAAVLAQAALRLPLEPWQAPAPRLLELRALTRRICELTKQGAAEKNRLKSAQASKLLGREVCASSERMIKLIKAEITRLEAKARASVLADETLARQFTLLQSVHGIAATSALRLLGELSALPPELGVRQWVAWAGLDPRPRESGQKHPPRRLSKQGNLYLRGALYMPALVAVRHEPELKAYYERLLGRGKPKMSALCAVMRKLLCCLWGMLHSDQPFNPQRLSQPASA